jgi:hypothetical protein
MATDGNLEELHTMAAQLGLKRQWFQASRSGRLPHYDLTPNKRALAIQLVAMVVESRELLHRCYPALWERGDLDEDKAAFYQNSG